jgi:predicted DCC family thiol-disulfide oxidoreductase YuxK
MSDVVFPLTVFYDHSCPLCRDEVELLRQHNSAQKLAFVDCSASDFIEDPVHSRNAMMRLIHARDANGVWFVGPPVFSAAYRAIGAESVATLWGANWLQPMWKRLYPRVADNRQWLSRTWVFSFAMRLFKRFVSWSANRRAERVAAQVCAVDQKDCL